MSTSYTPTLKLALPVTGELYGSWGDVINDNITSMIEQAIAGMAVVDTWIANSHTLTVVNGSTSESRCAILVAANGSGLSASGEIICSAHSKLYVLKNTTSYQITLKTSAGTGVAVASGDTAFLFCDGTNVHACVTTFTNGHVTGNLIVDGNTTLGNTTSDTITTTACFSSGILPSADNTYDLGSSGNSWKDLYIDGTATIADIILSGGTANGVPYLNASKVLTSGSALTFDGANLGLGVTPSAWGSGQKAIQIGSTGTIYTPAARYMSIGSNFYDNGTNGIYLTNGNATIYQQNRDSGVHAWYTSPSGVANTTTITSGVSYTIITAGNQTSFGAANNTVGTSFTANTSGTLSSGTVSQNISFTQAMTLDVNGNLLVGYTSSNGSYKLQVNSQIFATSSTIATSDGQYKTDVVNLKGDALEIVQALRPVQFSWKKHPVHAFDTDTPTIGFIAQEVKQVLANKPYLNSIVKLNNCTISEEQKDEDGNIVSPAVTEDFLGIAEGNMIAILTAAIQEQQSLIESLTQRLIALESKP